MGIRDNKGRFKSGVHNPKGRGRSVKDKLGFEFLSALQKSFKEHGEDAILRVLEDRPHEYLKLIGNILPKDINVGGQSDNPISVNIIIESDDDNDA